ncbi:hypothetical protein [Pseudoalteromonas luteoviolacea]|uniref:Uncharacterized protein n=1 Tax=Pseudoalteromonas luteoviolacea NCIMB 1942 TaxID=1365253 RepID=A0A161XW31_9GAMM|nr:hypothetical protein [Pseudoalteromonas luteoviolacea]KZN47399.1 hypothetical protein N482_09575 [Pseudoalteromonas luteoviolacea NCIMB 1942]KZW98804.1 hypothetical protein JL49_21115 [Pseudoalteromonas luteoviolacea]
MSDNRESTLQKSQSSSLIQRVKQNIRSIILGFAGVISAAVIPVWQIYFVETPEVVIEIASINRDESSRFRVPLDTDELALLEPYIPDELLYEYNKLGQRGDKIDYPEFTLNTVFSAYEKAKQDLKNMAVTKANLQKSIERIAAYLDPNNHQYPLIEFRVSELKEWDLSNYIDDSEARYFEEQVLAITRNYSQMVFDQKEDPEINIAALKFLLNDVKEDIHDVIMESSTRHERLRDDIRNIETQLQKLKSQQLELYTYFEVEIVASNAGRASTSLRPLALMRVKISRNNYVDIRLQLLDYTEQAELSPSSTNILRYRSSELNTFPQEDQGLINTFWGSTGQVRLYAMDTKHNVFVSNQTAFVDNRNQKLIVDKLKEVATSDIE